MGAAGFEPAVCRPARTKRPKRLGRSRKRVIRLFSTLQSQLEAPASRAAGLAEIRRGRLRPLAGRFGHDQSSQGRRQAARFSSELNRLASIAAGLVSSVAGYMTRPAAFVSIPIASWSLLILMAQIGVIGTRGLDRSAAKCSCAIQGFVTAGRFVAHGSARVQLEERSGSRAASAISSGRRTRQR